MFSSNLQFSMWISAIHTPQISNTMPANSDAIGMRLMHMGKKKH